MPIVTIQPGAVVVDGNVILNTFYHWNDGQYGLTGVHFTVITPGAGMTLGDCAWSIQTQFSPYFQNLLANNSFLLGSRCTKTYPVNTGKAGIASDDATGASGVQNAPTQISGIVSLYSQVRGQAGRGRMYVPFPSTSDITAATGHPTAGYVAFLQALGDALVPQLTLTSEDTTRTCFASSQIWHKGPQTVDPVLSARGQPYWGTMKKRGMLGRPNPQTIPN